MEATESQGSYPLEEPGRLSRSLLWQVQRRYFDDTGMAAWSEGVVPMYVTSNPFIARAYARVVAAFLQDWVREGSGEKVYVIELGAGSGRFAFNFLKQIAAAWQPIARLSGDARSADQPPITYVMTEYNEALLDFWQAHPALQPLLNAGLLDVASFDAAAPSDLTLRISGRTLTPGTTIGPLILIANYFFDSIPQDAFYVNEGQLSESLAALVSDRPEEDPLAPEVLGRSRLIYERRPTILPYYGDRRLDALLEGYRAELQDSGLAFPSAALRGIQFFDRLSGGRLLLLSSDKGYHRFDEVQGRKEPGFEVHGSFSMGVNYDALGRYFSEAGGVALYPRYRHLYLATCAFLAGNPPGGYGGTQRAYAEAVGEFGPEDFYLVQTMLEPGRDDVKPEQALALLRLSGWDPRIFQACFAGILAGLPSASPAVRAELKDTVERLWEGYYHIGESYDLAYDLGVLLYKLNEHRSALTYFERSLQLYGRQPKTLYNMGLCHYLLGEFGGAMSCMAEAIGIDAAFEPAQAMQRRLQTELRQAGSSSQPSTS